MEASDKDNVGAKVLKDETVKAQFETVLKDKEEDPTLDVFLDFPDTSASGRALRKVQTWIGRNRLQ